MDRYEAKRKGDRGFRVKTGEKFFAFEKFFDSSIVGNQKTVSVFFVALVVNILT